MGFLSFLWNVFFRIVSFFLFLILEISVFVWFYGVINEVSPGLSYILALGFVVYLIVKLVFRLFVGTTIGIFKFLFKSFI
jgi:hypothetical protein